MKISLPAFAILLLFAAAAPPAAAQDLEAARSAAITELRTTLEDHATWCDKEKLFLTRDQCFELLILIDVNHARARKALKYVRGGDGKWKQRKYKRPRNHDAKLVEEAEQVIADARKTFVDALHAALAVAEGQDKELVKPVIADLLKMDPDDAKAREWRGEVKYEGKWVLKETARSKQRREELLELSAEIIEAVAEPKKIDPTAEEKTLGLKWDGAYQGVWWRGLGSVDKDEVKHVLRIMDASHPFFSKMFGFDSPPPRGCGYYLLNDKDEARTVLTKHPLISDSKRDYFLTLRAAWIPGQQVFFQWSDNAGLRLDGSARMAIGILILRHFQIDVRRGWVWEGLGLYLDYLLTGSHRTVFVTRDLKTTTKRKPKFDIERRMKDAGADWILIAKQMCEEGSEPDLQAMAKRPVNSMTPEDLIYGHALASFIVEGYPDLATKFFVLHGNEEPIAVTIKRVFEVEPHEFVERFHRWLTEVR